MLIFNGSSTFNPLYTNEPSLCFVTMRLESVIVLFKGSQVKIFKLRHIFSLNIFLSRQTVKILMKCCIMHNG